MCSRVAVSSETGISCLAPRRSQTKAPETSGLGTWQGLPLAQGSTCAEEVRVPEKSHLPGEPAALRCPSPWPSPPTPGTSSMKQSLLLVCFWGHGKLRGNFHVSLSSTIKYLKSTVSEEDEEEQPSHNTQNSTTQTDTDRQADRPTPRLDDPLQPLTPVSLLCSQPWGTWGLEAGRGPCNHTKSASPALKPLT